MITQINEKLGLIFYEYKGDEIAWDGEGYVSLLTLGHFKTLEEMDEFWSGFARDYNKPRYENEV